MWGAGSIEAPAGTLKRAPAGRPERPGPEGTPAGSLPHQSVEAEVNQPLATDHLRQVNPHRSLFTRDADLTRRLAQNLIESRQIRGGAASGIRETDGHHGVSFIGRLAGQRASLYREQSAATRFGRRNSQLHQN